MRTHGSHACVSARKREASGKVLEMMLLPKKKGADAQHPWIWLKQILSP